MLELSAILANAAAASSSESSILAKEILLESEIEILIALHDGSGAATAWGCDLTYDYVKINGDYRT
jgi:glutamate N-acetyltransferase/amino-acid N-acetyltransferase